MAWELAQGWIGLVSRRVATLAMQVSQLANGALNVGETGVSGTESLCAGGLACALCAGIRWLSGKALSLRLSGNRWVLSVSWE